MKIILFILVTLMFTGCSSDTTQEEQVMEKELTVLVVGQSNIKARITSILYQPINDVRVLTNGEFVKRVVAGEHINITFDKIINDSEVTTIRYVNVAVDGSSAQSWSQGGSNFHKIAELGHVNFDMVVYHQGETDSYNGTSSDSYYASISSFVEGVTSLNPNVKIFVAIASYISPVGSSVAVTSAQHRVIQNYSNVFTGASTDGITDRYDGTHISYGGLIVASDMWVNEILSIL